MVKEIHLIVGMSAVNRHPNLAFQLKNSDESYWSKIVGFSYPAYDAYIRVFGLEGGEAEQELQRKANI